MGLKTEQLLHLLHIKFHSNCACHLHHVQIPQTALLPSIHIGDSDRVSVQMNGRQVTWH